MAPSASLPGPCCRRTVHLALHDRRRHQRPSSTIAPSRAVSGYLTIPGRPGLVVILVSRHRSAPPLGGSERARVERSPSHRNPLGILPSWDLPPTRFPPPPSLPTIHSRPSVADARRLATSTTRTLHPLASGLARPQSTATRVDPFVQQTETTLTKPSGLGFNGACDGSRVSEAL